MRSVLAFTTHVLRLALAAALLALALAVPAEAETGRVPLRACVARAAVAPTASAALADAAAFDCTTSQTRFGPGSYWVRLDGVDRAPPAPLSLRMASLWQGDITLAVKAGGRWQERHIAAHDYSRFVRIGAIVDLPVGGDRQRVEAILLRIDDSANLRGIVIAPRLETRAHSDDEALWMTGLYAGFGGLALALLIYNFVLWRTLRHRFQLYYSAMVAATIGYAFTTSAAILRVFPDLANTDRLRLNYVLLALTAAAAIEFLGAFFEKHVITRTVQRLIHASALFMVGSGLAFALFAPIAIAWLDRIYFMSFTAMLLLVFPLIGLAWTRKSQFLRMFLLAWSVPIAVTTLRAIYGFGLLPYSFWLDNGTMLAMGFESLINSAVIALRVQMLIEERDREKAQKGVAQALAETDPLTGLLNRRAFLSAAIAREGTRRLLLVDIDHFKRVNDTIGHDGGDQVLCNFALALRKWTPKGALLARLGGEEFGIILPAGSTDDAASLLAAIRSADLHPTFAITASIGRADGTLAHEDDWRDLYRRADAALYRAKADGRNRICVATNLARAA